MSDERVYSVSELTVNIKGILEQNLDKVWIKGEISNFSSPASGHLYFTLKDENNQIKVAMFHGAKRKFGFNIKDGQEVTVYGKVSIYGKRSEYQLIASDIQVLGVGALLVEYEKLKKKLADKGMFDAKYKQTIPKFPSKIGIITSRTGAAIRDILNILGRRFGNADVLIYPCLVQGDEAAPQITKAIQVLNEVDDIDVILLTRGGGSIEDLWAFNDENVANAIFESRKPIVSAVGHEIDFTIADFVSDLRAPTPSAAAELMVPDKKELINKLNAMKKSLSEALINKVKRGEERLSSLLKSYAFKMPFEIYNDYIRGFDDVIIRLDNSVEQVVDGRDDRLKVLKEKLEILNPMSILKKGYSVVYDENNNILTDAKSVKKGENLKIKLYKGEIEADVK